VKIFVVYQKNVMGFSLLICVKFRVMTHMYVWDLIIIVGVGEVEVKSVEYMLLVGEEGEETGVGFLISYEI
jgi:hypothetical protein